MDPRIDELARLVERFRIECERFLNGVHDADADSLRNRIVRHLRELRSTNLRSAAEQFRTSGLEARFNLLAENFGRRVREREEGRGVQRPVEPRVSRHDPEAGIVLGRSADPAAVEALFAGLARNGAANKMDLDTFRSYLERQVSEIRKKTGAEQVQFRLAQEDGKLKLKARPVGTADNSR